MQDGRESDWERVKQSSPSPRFHTQWNSPAYATYVQTWTHKVLTHPLPNGIHRHFSQKQITGFVQRQKLTPHSGHLFHTIINAPPDPPSSLHRSPLLANNKKKTLLVAFLRVLRSKTFRRVLWLSSGSPASSWADLRTPLCSSPGLSAGAAVHTVSKKQPRPRRQVIKTAKNTPTLA